MREIMGDPKAALHRRLDAAEVLLSYELGPGAAVGVDPDMIASVSYRFLKAVADHTATPEALKFRALKLVVSVENARTQARSSSITNADTRALLLNLINAERNRALRAAGVWPEVKETDAWALRSGDDFEAPLGWFSDSWSWPVTSFAAQLEQASDVTAFASNYDRFEREIVTITGRNSSVRPTRSCVLSRYNRHNSGVVV
jgi:hypothetical protein